MELRAGVIGAGFFGGLHARKYRDLDGVTLVGIADAMPAAAEKLAAETGASVMSPEALIAAVDIVAIASPAATHEAYALQALEARKHVYIEKPVALTKQGSDRLVAAADAAGVTVQVGHQERFVFAAFGLLDLPEAVKRITCVREGPFTGRGTDVSAALDLMTHDIDLVHAVAPERVRGIAARAKTVHGAHADEIEADLVLSDGTAVYLKASRIAPERRRFVKLELPSGEIEIDMLARTVRNTTPFTLGSAFEAAGEGLPPIATDPLGYAIGAFVRAVRTGEEPLVTVRDGARALSTALDILDAVPLADRRTA